MSDRLACLRDRILSRQRSWQRIRSGHGALILLLALGACSRDPLLATTVPADAATQRQSDTASYAQLMRVADDTRQAGDANSAAAIYRRAHDVEPKRPEPLVKLGFALLDAGDPTDASEAFRQAIELDGKDAQAHLGLGTSYLATDHPELARVELTAAARTLTRDARVHSGLGIADDLTGDHAAAQSHYRQGLALAPDSRPLKNDLALSLALSGRYDEAISTLRPVALQPQATVRNRQNLALIYGLAGQMDEAARIARIDLDDKSVQSNLEYYTTLRALADSARTAAILKPSGAGVPPRAAAADVTGRQTQLPPPIRPAS